MSVSLSFLQQADLLKCSIFVFAGKQFNMSDVHGCLFLGAEMLSSYDLECYSFVHFFLRCDHPVLHTCLQERLSNIILLYPICEYTKYQVVSPLIKIEREHVRNLCHS